MRIEAASSASCTSSASLLPSSAGRGMEECAGATMRRGDTSSELGPTKGSPARFLSFTAQFEVIRGPARWPPARSYTRRSAVGRALLDDQLDGLMGLESLAH